jgi:hypothetical protein
MKLRKYIKVAGHHDLYLSRSSFCNYISDLPKLQKTPSGNEEEAKASSEEEKTSSEEETTCNSDSTEPYVDAEEYCGRVENALSALLKLHETSGQQLIIDVFEE